MSRRSPMVYLQDPERTVRVYRGRPATCLLCWEVKSHCRALYVRSYRDPPVVEEGIEKHSGRRDYVRLGWICPSCVAKCLDHMDAERQLLEDVLEAP